MIGHAHWYGEGDSSFALVHWPAGLVRGAVVICPPLGYESVCAYPALRLLAERLSDCGYACIRVGFPSMSNTVAGNAEADRVPAWRTVIRDAVDLVRGFGIAQVAVVGLRFSAVLAAQVAAEAGLDAAVLWDPVMSGRRYVRALRMLGASDDADKPHDGIVVAGVSFNDATLDAIAAANLQAGDLDASTLVVLRSEVDSDFAAHGSSVVTVERMAGTAAMLDVDAELSVIPTAIVARIGTFIEQALAGAGVTMAAPALSADTTVSEHGVTLRHSAVRLAGGRLFAVTTSVDGATPSRAVLFLNNGAAPNLGPGGAWLDWANDVARDGALCVRLDFGGLGDSAPISASVARTSYPLSAAEDIGAVLVLLAERGIVRVATVGLCSGAVLAFDAAMRYPEIELLIAINARFDKPFTDGGGKGIRAAGRTNRLLAIPLSKAPLFPMFDRVPRFVWSILRAVRLVPSPTQAIERVVRPGRQVLLLFGASEWGHRALIRRAPRRLAALVRSPYVRLHVLDELDHSMFAPSGRRVTEQHVLADLRSGFLEHSAGTQSLPTHNSSETALS